VPEGYEAKGGFVMFNGACSEQDLDWSLWVNVGSFNGKFGGNRSALYAPLEFQDPLTGDIASTLFALNIRGYAAAVELLCELSEASLAVEKWQLATFSSIREAYEQQMAEYTDKVAAASISQGVAIQGRNPIANREMETTELKRLAISVLTGQHFDVFGTVTLDGSGFPRFDFDEARLEGEYASFFEQAFEWENMTYLFYPYYWGRKAMWNELRLAADVDPLFQRFLQAGSARVNVPVRPGYEDVVTEFMDTGLPWGGAGVPGLNSPLYVDIAAEQRRGVTNQGRRVDQWQERLPTSLVVLEPLGVDIFGPRFVR
jgi:hypothetical protein